MRIAIATPTGNVGRHLTTALIRAGVRPLLLARRPGAIPRAVLAHADVAEADLTDARQVAEATRGVDVLYWVDPSVWSADPLADYARATRALVHAVTARGIGRVVFQSSVGAEKRHGAGEIDGLAGTEVALDDLGVDVTHLRCGYFFTNLLLDLDAVRRGCVQTVMEVDAPMSWVAPRDIAEVAALALLDTSWHGRRVRAVHGPEDLTWNKVAGILSDQVGHVVRAERIGDAQMRRRHLAAGMPPAMADAVMGMSVGLRDGFRPEQVRTLATTPTTLAAWIREELLPVL